jgi:hypothetical protein
VQNVRYLFVLLPWSAIMSCLERTPTRPTVHPLQWEFLRQQLLKVRWPGTADPHVSFAIVQGVLIGLEMAGVIDQEANRRMFWLLTDAQDRRWAEDRQTPIKAPSEVLF